MTRDLLTDAVSAVEIVSSTGYRWLGALASQLPAEIKRHLSAEAARGYLLRMIESRLYDACYCQGRPIAVTGREQRPPAHGLGTFVAALSQANCGDGCWESGWAVERRDEHALELTRGGLTLLASEGDWRARGSGDFELRLPKELLRLSPGYYIAVLDHGLPESGPVVRLYWNLRAAGAIAFVREATRFGNGAGIRGRLKVVNDPRHFDRADAAVMYVAGDDLGAVAELARVVHRRVSVDLNAHVPGFTKKLAPGVAVAEDPGGGSSFGQHRCHLVAEGIVRAHERGHGQIAGRVAVVREVMAEHGVDPDAPYRRGAELDNWNPLT